jgi:signal transduction histidine kinase
MHNLLKNALEAMPPGHSGKMAIGTRLDNESGASFVEVKLHDNGPGIAPEQAERIFEPYVTTKTQGTGLGLAIVKRIIEEIGGSIRLDMTSQPGACFIIRLPISTQPATREPTS